MESMRLGLDPIVTPVGEISRYCKGNNSIIVYSNKQAVRDIILILESQDFYDDLSKNASLEFKTQSSYVDSIVQNTEEMVKKWFL